MERKVNHKRKKKEIFDLINVSGGVKNNGEIELLRKAKAIAKARK
jgi:hypothetical protein